MGDLVLLIFLGVLVSMPPYMFIEPIFILNWFFFLKLSIFWCTRVLLGCMFLQFLTNWRNLFSKTDTACCGWYNLIHIIFGNWTFVVYIYFFLWLSHYRHHVHDICMCACVRLCRSVCLSFLYAFGANLVSSFNHIKYFE